ncbi:MAG TPA: ribonuclease H-like domain-containing protein [Dehalococcoidia bacterium]|nr:ribonuclease H-like domain-containing protein [Dehalococcoidia bacterium]
MRPEAPALDRRRAERLRAAVAASTPPRRAPAIARELPPIDRILGGEWIEGPCGPAFVRDAWHEPQHRYGRIALGAALRAPSRALEMLGGARPAPHPSRCAFVDIETTGLGGAGTYVVIAGLGSFERDGFRMRQYFLADIAGERAMLAALAQDLARFDGIVTYNGRAFDVPVLESRFTVAGAGVRRLEQAHLDLLPPARRLYRHRLPGCRLVDLERALLGLERFDDVPGALVPSLYFGYVRAGRAAPLRPVFRHNADDVLALVSLLASLARLLTDDAPRPEDAAALARWHEHAGDIGRAMALYRASLPWLEGSDDWRWAAWRHARLCLRAGARGEALPLLHGLWAAGDPRAGLALAKHLEHRDRRYAAAREIATRLLLGAQGRARAGLEHRLARLNKKLSAV